ncbi:hypothetical protein PLESTB_001197800 [Pleodorina starrii]|uniref:START domain-containing protein n=1 Tax=Pleodorina starrii TaxID=330485 RepID=A0A9W6BRU0_9CHLO|nr:hypothetical protein PLESTM_001835400 [Pleodorina starrii]GLC57199.1 hypothetical protein PLESTB_001197800 [Pleodorina starrii]GLC71419.1 hypothetical protein PLESTF_001114000 [Pleodorina starrii]
MTVERQPVGCFCFFRRDHKVGKAKGAGGATVAVGAAHRVTAEPGLVAAALPAEREPQPGVQVRVSATASDGVPTPPESGPTSPVAPAQAPPATDVGLRPAAAVPTASAAHTPPSACSATTLQPPALRGGAPPPQAADSLLEPAPSLRGFDAAGSLSVTAAAAAAATHPAAAIADAATAAAAADAAAAANATDAAAATEVPDAIGAPEPDTVAANEAGGSAASVLGAVATIPGNPASTSPANDTAVTDPATAALPDAVTSSAGGAAGAVRAAAADAVPAPDEEAFALSTVSSRCSTEFYSAGGWSQFGGEDGELLGGPAAALSLFHSLEVPDVPATTAAGSAAAGSAAAGSAAAGSAAAAMLGQHASNNEACSNVQEREPQQQQQQRDHRAGPCPEDGPASRAEAPAADSRAPATGAAPAEGSGLAAGLPPSPLRGSAPHAPLPPAGPGSSPSAPPLVDAVHQPVENPEGTERRPVLGGDSGGGHEQRQQEPQQQQQERQQQQAEGASPGGRDAVGAWANGSNAGAEGSGAAAAAAQPQGTGAAAAAAAASSRDAVLDQVADLYGVQARPCKACQTLLHFCKANGVAPESLAGELQARGLPDAEALTKVVRGVSERLADLASDEGWHMVRNDELQLLYRNLPGSSVHAFRARCTLEHPVEQLLALTREVDLVPSWNKYCTTASVLREMSVTDVVVYMALWVPWPFHNVGFLLEANGADLYEEEGRLLVCFQSPNTRPAQGSDGTPASPPPAPPPVPPPVPPPTLPPGSEKHTRVRMLAPSCISLRPLPPKSPGGPTRTHCEVQCYVDPGLRHVPPFIISFVLRVFSPFMYAAVKKALAAAFKSPTSPLPQRIQQRPELYDLVRRRTEAFLRPRAADGKDAAAAATTTGAAGAAITN